MITVFGNGSIVKLNEIAGFGFSPERAQSARTAIAGNVIRQVSTLHPSTGSATYSNTVDNDAAARLAAIHTSSHAVFVTHRGKSFEAVMSYVRNWSARPGYSDITLTFNIVRQVI